MCGGKLTTDTGDFGQDMPGVSVRVVPDAACHVRVRDCANECLAMHAAFAEEEGWGGVVQTLVLGCEGVGAIARWNTRMKVWMLNVVCQWVCNWVREVLFDC